jgi:hypothetical protein
LGVRKSDGVPEHESLRQAHESHEEKGDKESPKGCTHLKVVNPFTRAIMPLYRETKGLLHSEITLESKEYS